MVNRRARCLFADYLKTTGLKDTTQRALILDTFLSSGRHVSVEDLHLRLARINRRVGFATLYRTMKLIAHSGLAREVVFNDGVVRFEPAAGKGHHHHLICMRCGKVIEFSSRVMDKEESALAVRYQFEVHSHEFKIIGLCRQCQTTGRPGKTR